MGSSYKHRGEKEATGTRDATEQPPRQRECKKDKRRSGSSGGERGSGRQEPEAHSSAHRRQRSRAEPSERRGKREKCDRGHQAAASSKPRSGDASPLSIQETQKLRAQLGLKPLEGRAGKKGAGTINPVALQQREQLAAPEEKRLPNHELRTIQTLREEDPRLHGPAAWVERTRQLQTEKHLAEQRARLLEEMDREFGLSAPGQEEFGQRRQSLCSARDLQGLAVGRAVGSFGEGDTRVLTLRDKGVVQEGEEVLVTADRVEKERAEKDVALRQEKPDRLPYAEDQSVDDPAQQNPRRTLSEYHGELGGERPHCFRLHRGGGAAGLRERERDETRAQLRLQAQPLSAVGPRLASEVFTPEEMVTFRKTKRKVRKIRETEKERIVRADGLLPLGDQTQDGDLGSRLRGPRGRRGPRGDQEAPEEEQPAPQSPQSEDTGLENMDISQEDGGGGLPPGSPEALELQKQLEKGRRLRQLRRLRGSGQKVVEMVKTLESRQRGWEGEEEDPARRGAIVFSATSEFCRALGETPTHGLASHREEQEELMDLEREEDRPAISGSEPHGEENMGCSAVQLEEETQPRDFSASSTAILDEEPLVNRGLAAALLLCQKEGLLERTVQQVARGKAPNKALRAGVGCIEDKMAIDDEDGRRGQCRGFPQDFKEKDGYKPDVKLEYVDETGRKLTPKEAFRQLSHRFHGKGSGKVKTERRMRKLHQEALLQKMSSGDTPLGTAALLRERQKAQMTPYLVLSGSGESMDLNTISK